MIRDFTDNDFDRVFEIIEESFPRDEHGTYEEHKKLLADPDYKIYILEDDETGVIKGFMSVWDLGDGVPKRRRRRQNAWRYDKTPWQNGNAGGRASKGRNGGSQSRILSAQRLLP